MTSPLYCTCHIMVKCQVFTRIILCNMLWQQWPFQTLWIFDQRSDKQLVLVRKKARSEPLSASTSSKKDLIPFLLLHSDHNAVETRK